MRATARQAPGRRPPEVTGPGAAWVPRLSGAFVAAAGLASLALAQLSRGPGASLDAGHVWLLGLAGAALGLLAWFVPWGALPAGSSLSVPVAALALLLLLDRVSELTTSPGAAAAYPLYLLLVLTWVGLSQPRSTALAFSLCAGSVTAYVLLRHEAPALGVWSLAVILPVGVVLGETAAWLAARGRVLDRRELRRAGDLERLTRLLAGLAAEDDLDRAAALVAREATALFGCAGASVELSSADGARASAQHGVVDTPGPTIPLVGGRQQVGRVELHGGGEATDRYVEGLSQLFAIQVGTTVAQLHTISELGRAVRRDALTGTGNRRHATELLDTLRPGDALLVVDLDRFKDVNDTWGHRAGDEVLHQLGTYLQACVRSSDDVARVGGDEFVVVARGAGSEVAATAERLLRGWREAGHRTTISIGGALHRPDGETEATFDRADAALYEAKARGRDQVAIASR